MIRLDINNRSQNYIDAFSLVMRVLLSGKAPAFQAGYTGSIPVTRSKKSLCFS